MDGVGKGHALRMPTDLLRCIFNVSIDHLLVEKTVKLERVNGYQYKKNLPNQGEDSLPRSLKESLCGSTSSLEKKWPPPPEVCLLDNEDCEPRRPDYRDGLATLPKTTNTNNKNLDK